MGTRSMTYVTDGETPIVAMYRQYDGYVCGHGHELAEFLSGKSPVNGFGTYEDGVKEFNGVEDLAMRTVAHFKPDADKIGGFYLVPPNAGQEEEYNYYVSVRDDNVRVRVDAYGHVIFDGTPTELLTFVESDES